MPRIDIWDVEAAAKKLQDINCGYPRDFSEHFQVDRILGKGGFGLVRVVIEKSSGTECACKTIKKRLDIPGLSVEKQAAHLDNVKREIQILKRLRGTLSVVHFKGAWEDDENIHLVMEYCRGGELVHQVGRRAYSEETAATYMKSVLHTLAQCHSHRILHRDIKPGNFMLLTEEEDSPLKAIDFGLAVFFDPAELPRTDLGLEGTPWFMAPEVLSSETFPASDIWAAGIMAYQLLSGYLPFDDARNPEAPALSVIWKGILTEEPSFRRSAWKEISDEAKDFVKTLLTKDHTKRPTAKQALLHPWLQAAFHSTKKRPISHTVVQRIQRFAQTSVVKRTILELIAAELLKMMPPALSVHGGGQYQAMLAAQQDAEEAASEGRQSLDEHGGDVFAMSPDRPSPFSSALGSPPGPRRFLSESGGAGDSGHGGDSFKSLLGRSVPRSGGSLHGGRQFARSPSARQLAALAAAGRKGASVHGAGEYWRVMRAASELAAMESGHGQHHYLRTAPRSEEERAEQRKAARLSLDTSAHGGDHFADLLKRLESARSEELAHKKPLRGSQSTGNLRHPTTAIAGAAGASPPKPPTAAGAAGPAGWPAPLPPVPEVPAAAGGHRGFPPPEALAEETPARPSEEEGGRRGRGGGAYKALLEASGGGLPPRVPLPHEAAAAQQAEQQQPQAQQQPQQPAAWPASALASAGVAPAGPGGAAGGNGGGLAGGGGSSRGPKRVSFGGDVGGGAAPMAVDVTAAAPVAGGGAGPSGAADTAGTAGEAAPGHKGPITTPQELEALMRQLKFKRDQGLSTDALSKGLHALGYDLEPSEVAILMSELDMNTDGTVQPHEFVASQLDWTTLQQSNRELWLECARRAFASLDQDSDGRLKLDAILQTLRTKLPADEVDYAVEDALMEAGYADADEMDFEGFLRMVQVGSMDSLDSLDQYDPRLRHAGQVDDAVHRLESVPEHPPGTSPRPQ